MNKSDVGQWVTAATNLAVLLGVVILVIELRQNADLAALEMIQGRTTASQEVERAFFDPDLTHVWVKSFKSPASMTLEEIRTMDAYLAIQMSQMWRIHDLERAGLLERGGTLRTIEPDLHFLFGSRFGKAWWAQEGQNWPPEFVELIRPVVESVDVDGLNERFGRLQRLLGAE